MISIKATDMSSSYKMLSKSKYYGRLIDKVEKRGEERERKRAVTLQPDSTQEPKIFYERDKWTIYILMLKS